jgi:hypothetical protein
MLPEADTEQLHARGLTFQVTDEGGTTCVVISGWQLPQGYDRETTDLLLRLSPGYPDVQPDMWWFDPPVLRADKTPLPATEVTETVVGRTWQRWSRHFNGGQWQAGIDGLESYLALIRQDLEKGASGVAA